jgi:hypothetical protein
MIQAHWKYLKYVVRHKWYVFLACRQLGVPLWQSIIHDWTKLLPCEWFPYVQFFYGQPKIGDQIDYQGCEGISGRATIIETRRAEGAQYKVRIHDGYIGEGQELWAHDFEVPGVCEGKAAFDRAWNHHQKANKHHWQYWVLTFDHGGVESLEMPERYMAEMVADWVGAGRAINGYVDVEGWYAKNRDKMKLNEKTRAFVESIIRDKYPTQYGDRRMGIA